MHSTMYTTHLLAAVACSNTSMLTWTGHTVSTTAAVQTGCTATEEVQRKTRYTVAKLVTRYCHVTSTLSVQWLLCFGRLQLRHSLLPLNKLLRQQVDLQMSVKETTKKD